MRPDRKMYLEGGIIGFNPKYVEWLEKQLEKAYALIESSGGYKDTDKEKLLTILDEQWPDKLY